MSAPRRHYQDEAAAFFRSMGLAAEVDLRVQGVRTSHDIDVVVDIDVSGFAVRWLVECKHWQTAVSKLHVMALREIVADVGADRGILLCEAGFQSGAVEAANLTNVQVTSLSTLATSSKDSILAVRIQQLSEREEVCRTRYWDLPKDVRIEHGLRFGTPGTNYDLYSGARIVDLTRDILVRSLRSAYPIEVDPFYRVCMALPERLLGHEDTLSTLEPLISDLERRLNTVLK